jgi:hypothetical protein
LPFADVKNIYGIPYRTRTFHYNGIAMRMAA